MVLSATKLVAAIGGKNLVIPDEGWNASNFAAHGQAMIVALSRVGRIVQRQKSAEVTRIATEIFSRQLEFIVAEVMRPLHQRSLIINVNNPQTWLDAINKILKETQVQATAVLAPPIQSTMAQGYSKTSIVLNQPQRDISGAVQRKAWEIAKKVTNINETTRQQIIDNVNRSIDEGLTVTETAQNLQRDAPALFGYRAQTIARTELNRAWTEGSMQSFKESHTMTHVSVIGCEAREQRSPHYKGQSTCNYPDLPVTEIDAFMEVGFHPNHTGNVVPSGFRNADGTHPDIAPD